MNYPMRIEGFLQMTDMATTITHEVRYNKKLLYMKDKDNRY